jgi:hypothetical protein
MCRDVLICYIFYPLSQPAKHKMEYLLLGHGSADHE